MKVRKRILLLASLLMLVSVGGIVNLIWQMPRIEQIQDPKAILQVLILLVLFGAGLVFSVLELVRQEIRSPIIQLAAQVARMKEWKIDGHRLELTGNRDIDLLTRALNDLLGGYLKEENITRTFIEASPDMIFLLDEEGCVLFGNMNVARQWNFQVEEIIGKRQEELFPPDVAERHKQVIKKIFETGQPVSVDVYEMIGERHCWINARMIPVLDQDGGVRAVMGISSDITTRKQAEKALQDSEARYRVLFETSTDGILIADLETKVFKYANPAICGMFGYTMDELKTLGIANIYPKDAWPRVAAEFATQTRGEKTLAADLPCIRKDGTIFYADVNATTITVDHRQCIVGFFRDTTARKRAEEALRESENRYRGVFAGTPDGIIVHDAEGLIRDANEAMAQRLEIQREALLGRQLAGFVTPDNAAKISKNARIALAGQSQIFETTYVSASGKTIPAEVHERRIQWRDGQAVISISRDISARKEAEEDLQKAHDELEQRVQERTAELNLAYQAAEAANRAKSDFLANMSHELRTPLGAIIGFSELLNEKLFGALNPKQEEYVKDILGSGQHLLSLINDILDLAKIEAGKTELELSSFPIAPLLENSLVMVTEKCLKHGISLTTDIADTVKDLVILADERKLKQIMFNLLSNAAKFTPDGGQIRVSANLVAECGTFEVGTRNSEQGDPNSERGTGKAERGSLKQTCGIELKTPISDFRVPRSTPSAIEISVSDTGIGIAKEHQANIFEEFYQVASSAKGKPAGTGLGLSLVKRMVEQHGGRVRVESEGEGKGSTFRFTIPPSPPQGLVQAVRAHLNLAARDKKPGGLALFLFSLDTDAISKAGSAADSGKGVTANDVWATLAEKASAHGVKSAFSGNEFIVTAAVDNKAETVVQEKLRRLLKDILFQMVPCAVADFSCGVAPWTAGTTDADELLAAARKTQMAERDRIAAKHVVIVDDESQIRKIMRKELKQLGFVHIDEASGGEDLFRLLQSQTPDLIILDIYMPGMNGYEVIGRLKAHTPTAKIPVLVLSGRDVDSSELHKKSPATAIHVLVKPLGLDALNNHVSYLL